MMVVSGAYGRDYKSAKAAKADWDAGKDFVIRSLDYMGSYVSKSEVAGSVMLRYNRDRSVVAVKGGK